MLPDIIAPWQTSGFPDGALEHAIDEAQHRKNIIHTNMIPDLDSKKREFAINPLKPYKQFAIHPNMFPDGIAPWQTSGFPEGALEHSMDEASGAPTAGLHTTCRRLGCRIWGSDCRI